MHLSRLLLLCVVACSSGCPLLDPAECDVTTTSGGVSCELEDNGRYACTCETGRTFVSDDFCSLSPGDQDVNVECVGDGYCFDSSDCAADETCDRYDNESRCEEDESEDEGSRR